MNKVLVVSHKQIYYSNSDQLYYSIGGFSAWHNSLSNSIKELHILSPIKRVDALPAGASYLNDKIKFHPNLQRSTDFLKTIIQTYKITKAQAIDVVVCRMPGFIGASAVIGAWLSSKPAILQVVGDWTEVIKSERTNIIAKIIRIFAVEALLFMDCLLSKAIIAQSYNIKEKLKRKGFRKKRICVIPGSSIDKTYFEIPEKKQKEPCKTILFIGRLSIEKGLLVLIEAAFILKTKVKYDFKLIIIGDGKLRKLLEQRVKEYNLSDQILFKGFVSHEDTKQYLRDCDVFTIPSLSEGSPKVLLESMAAMRPIVATCVGGIPDMVTSGVNGLLIKPDDPTALAEALDTLLNDETVSLRMGKEARESAKKYKLERIMSMYTSFASSVL